MADANKDLVAIADVRTYLKIDSGNTSETTILTSLISQVSERFASAVGRPLVSIQRVEYYDGNGESELILRCCPIVTLTSIYNADMNREFTSEESITIADDVIVQKQTGIITLYNNEATFLKGIANVKVTYTAGWVVSSTVPHDVEDAVKKWIAQQYTKYDKKRHERISQNQGDLTTTFIDEEIPKEVIPVINKYKDRLGAPDFSYMD